MATFTIIEINGDHTGDLEFNDMGEVLRQCVANPYNADRILAECNLNRAIRVICQSGHPISTTVNDHLWLNPSVERIRVKPVPEPDREPLLTCHKCRHQQPRDHSKEDHAQVCTKCGSTEVWV